MDHMPLLTNIFRIAYAKGNNVEVLLVLTSIRCGFFSDNETVCKMASDAMILISDELYNISYEYGIKVKQLKNKKNQIVQVKIPIFRQFQDWFIQPKSFNYG